MTLVIKSEVTEVIPPLYAFASGRFDPCELTPRPAEGPRSTKVELLAVDLSSSREG